MKVRLAVLLAVASLVCSVSFAQDSPKVEATGDYSYFRVNPGPPSYFNSQNLNGGGGDITFFLKPMFGFKADLQGYGSFTHGTKPGAPISGCASGNLFTYMFGPELKARAVKFEPFAEVLLGGDIPTFTPMHAIPQASAAQSLRPTMPSPWRSVVALISRSRSTSGSASSKRTTC
jgi:hypothetical protein